MRRPCLFTFQALNCISYFTSKLQLEESKIFNSNYYYGVVVKISA